MLGKRFGMLSAELYLLRSRVSTWVLLAIWCLLALTFSYFVAYVTYTNEEGSGGSTLLEPMLPEQLVARMISGFPFYGGAIALMLGVLSVGSEFGWGTFKTLFSQRPGRSEVVGAKVGALAIMLIPFVVFPLALGAAASAFIAWREDASMVWPGVMTIVQGVLAGWLIVAVWAAVGVLLAVATRGTSLAIGIGIIYTLVFEGLVGALLNQVELLQPVIEVLVRANAYSLVRPLGGAGGGTGQSAATGGPGAFSGPFVDETQALLVMIGYLVVFLSVSVWLLRRRDVD